MNQQYVRIPSTIEEEQGETVIISRSLWQQVKGTKHSIVVNEKNNTTEENVTSNNGYSSLTIGDNPTLSQNNPSVKINKSSNISVE